MIKKEKGRIYTSEQIVSDLFGLKLLHQESGAPALEGGCGGFSISHTKDWWICVMAPFPVAIDIEEKKREIKPGLAKRLHPREQQYLAGLEEGSREWKEEFLQIWTRKECVMKRTEEGLALGLQSFSVLSETLEYEDPALGIFYSVDIPALQISVLSAEEDEINLKRVENKGRAAKSALEKATDLLAERSFSSGELKAKLVSKGYTPEEAAQALTILTDRGYINDSEYMQAYVKKCRREGKASLRIARELKLKGYDDSTIKVALSDDFDEMAQAMEIAEKMMQPDADEKLFARIARKLASRGFKSSTIYSVIDRLRS